MSGSTISPAGIPSPTDPSVAAAVAGWVAAADGDQAAVLAAVVQRVAGVLGIDVEFRVGGEAVVASTRALDVAIDPAVLSTYGPWLPGFVREALTSSTDRRAGGVHHTSPAMAAALVDFADSVAPFGPNTTVEDPAVGGGAFLLAAGDRIGPNRVESLGRLAGTDVDPVAVAVTTAALTLWSGGTEPPDGAIRVADGIDPCDDAAPSLVLGNPPFRSQLRDGTVRRTAARAALAARWPGLGGYVDDAAAFLLAAIDRVDDGGVVALVQPASVLSARDATAVRERVLAGAPPVGVWIDGERRFEAAVDTIALVLVKGATPGPVARATGVPARVIGPHTAALEPGSWAELLRPDGSPALTRTDLRTARTVGDVASVTAGFRDHFYGLRGAVRDDPSGEHPLITSGLIDPLESRWGAHPCRFDGNRWHHPVVDLDAVAPAIAGWITERLVPKLLLASQTKVVEVVVDRAGVMVPCTPVVSVEPGPYAPSLAHLAAALTSPPIAVLLVDEARGSALSRDAIRVAAPAIAALPLPEPGPAWDAAAEAVTRWGTGGGPPIEEIGRLGLAAYGVADRDDVLAWWRSRLPRR